MLTPFPVESVNDAATDELTIVEGPVVAIGIEVENLTSEEASKAKVSGGVVISAIQPNSPLLWAGVRKGALILEINKQPIASVEEFNQLLDAADPERPLLFLIKQDNMTRYISFKAR